MRPVLSIFLSFLTQSSMADPSNCDDSTLTTTLTTTRTTRASRNWKTKSRKISNTTNAPPQTTNAPQTTNVPQTTSVPQNGPLQSSVATYYFRVGNDVEGCPVVQTFNDNNRYGPCKSADGSSGVLYTESSKYWAAIANAKDHCGETIRVFYNNNYLDLQVMDECVACHLDNHVDMSLDALIELTGTKELACAINTIQPNIMWKFTA